MSLIVFGSYLSCFKFWVCIPIDKGTEIPPANCCYSNSIIYNYLYRYLLKPSILLLCVGIMPQHTAYKSPNNRRSPNLHPTKPHLHRPALLREKLRSATPSQPPPEKG